MSEKNDINTLRETLFDTLKRLKDENNPMPVEQAKAINDVAQTIINSAKVEVEHLRIYQGLGKGSGFIPVEMISPVPNGKGGFIFKVIKDEAKS